MSNKFIISGYLGFKNFGDEAILSVLVKKLQENKDNKITVISSDTEYTKNKFKNINSVPTFDIKQIISAMFKSDVLISGGGSLLQDATSFKSLIYYLGIIFLALFLRKKVIIFAQGIGPINNAFGRFLTRIILYNCKYISVRDAKSQELLTSWGIKSDLLCDPIFSVAVDEVEKDEVVAVQLRNYKTLTQDFIDRLAQKVVNEFPDKEIKIYPFQKDVDIEVCENFKNAVNLLNSDIKISIIQDLTDRQIVDSIARAKYLVAMRFHAIIVGLLTGAKIIAINYDIKVEKIANEFSIPLLDMKKPFKDQFKQVKELDTDLIHKKVMEKKFVWTGFESAISG